MCFLGITVITDYDSGVDENRSIEPVTLDVVNARMSANIGKTRALIAEIIKTLPEKRSCNCKDSLVNAAVGVK